ncbi:uncharacterized protein CMU_027460 [Cryptosporidium muris RN66]|uniref:Uncharacterized protein n=1 Tax=Cryptosporidium muris (strain RN66) TaxID=441375 RepID=B6ABI4_CRYMR|nr:uncharacterized protein CMU_027460 [Cryptosporidium muris RN66]EEA05736.1 hypothetical protein, conserved [Cryptosporidium muris RN66]|eukprot:XP_002140085.1 hypothetical protein [Cryptosporidium muris RN66]
MITRPGSLIELRIQDINELKERIQSKQNMTGEVSATTFIINDKQSNNNNSRALNIQYSSDVSNNNRT